MSDVNPYNDTSDHWYHSTPGREFYEYGALPFDRSSIVALSFTCLLVFFPLILGARSLLWSFYFFLPAAFLLNILLFFRAVTLPNLSVGLEYFFLPSFDRYDVSTWEILARAVTGDWVGAQFGCLFLLGKYAGDETFTFPRVLIGGVLILAINFLNLFKMAGFANYYAELNQSAIDEFFGSWYLFDSMPVLLSQLPAARFWLLVHFLFVACTYLPFYSFAFETVASCIAEMLPASFADRQKFPQNLVVTVPLDILCRAISMGFLYGAIGEFDRNLNRIFYRYLNIGYYLAITLVIQAILPLTLSKVANLGRYEDLLAFVGRQARAGRTSAIRIITMLCICVGGFVILTMSFHFSETLSQGIHFESRNFGSDATSRAFIVSVVIVVVVILLIVLGVVVQTVLFLVNGKKYPCCAPLGKPITVEDRLGEELFPITPAVGQGP